MKLNIGSGSQVLEGFTPIDRKYGTEAYPLEGIADGSVEEIRASHVLEHFTWGEARKVLAEWARVLQDGGVIRIAVPDFDKICDPASAKYGHKRLNFLMGGQTDENDIHRSAWTAEKLEAFMKRAGFGEFTRWESSEADCASMDVSLNIEARKVKQPEEEHVDVSIVAVMSIPRIGWNDARDTIENTLRVDGIPLWTHNSVFWAEGLQTLFDKAVEAGIDWIIALDYDSMITHKHLRRLLDIMARRSDIDALAAMQPRRGTGMPLLTIPGIDGDFEVSNQPVQVATAHFGMTILRTSALKDTPKPWFFGLPNAAGDWGDSESDLSHLNGSAFAAQQRDQFNVKAKQKIDADIWFWKQWAKAGKTAYVAPDVRIGHLELKVAHFDDEGQRLVCKHTDPSDWRERFAPAGAAK